MLTDQVQRRLKALPRALRVAATAFCVEHVLPVFELTYEERGARQPHAAIDLAWRHAGGMDVPRTTIEQMQSALGALMKVMNASNLTLDAAKDVCAASIYLLDCIVDPSDDKSVEHAVRAVGFAHEAVQLFEDYAGPGSDEEAAVQERVFRLAESWGDRPITRAMFEDLRRASPSWLDNRDETP